MPNIEVFGVKVNGSKHKIIESIIYDLSEEDRKDLVLTVHESSVKDASGCNASYVRITDTDIKRAERIAGLLFKNVVDVEIMILAKFIPKEIKLDKTRPI